MEVSSIGTNASTATAGACKATAPTTNTSVAAMLYAGATEAVAMIVVEISPSAPDFRPLSTCCSADPAMYSAVAIYIFTCPGATDPGVTVLALFTVFYKGFRSNNSVSTVDFVPEGVSIHDMRILLVGAGGVGSAIAAPPARRGFAQLDVADYDLARAQRAVAGTGAGAGADAAIRLDARDPGAVTAALQAYH